MNLTKDLENVESILRPYKNIIKDASDDIKLNGENIVQANVRHPSLLAYYDEKKVELKHFLNFADIMLKRHRGEIYSTIKKNYPKALTVGEIDKLIESDETYITMYCRMLDIREAYEKMNSIVTSMGQKSYTLTNLVKIYESDLQNITMYLDE